MALDESRREIHADPLSIEAILSEGNPHVEFVGTDEVVLCTSQGWRIRIRSMEDSEIIFLLGKVG